MLLVILLVFILPIGFGVLVDVDGEDHEGEETDEEGEEDEQAGVVGG